MRSAYKGLIDFTQEQATTMRTINLGEEHDRPIDPPEGTSYIDRCREHLHTTTTTAPTVEQRLIENVRAAEVYLHAASAHLTQGSTRRAKELAQFAYEELREVLRDE